MELMRVQGTNIHAVGYDPDAATMQIQFTNGDVYAYQNVEPDTYTAMTSGNIGSYFASIIKPQRYKYVFTKMGNMPLVP